MEKLLFTKKGIVFIVSAPSGAGKSTVLSEIVKRDSNIKYSISYTTRAKRGSEVDGQDYFFVSKQKFEEMIKDNLFAEYAEVYGNYYGTSIDYLKDEKAKGHDLILDIDTQGAALIKKSVETVSIFIVPPSMQELTKRLNNRGTDTKEVIAQRQSLVKDELLCIKNYDYIVVNDRIEKAVQDLLSIINAERSRCLQNIEKLNDAINEFMGEC